MQTTVVNKLTDEYDVDITRPGPFGNPFVIGRDGSRSVVIQKFKRFAQSSPEFVARIRSELRGKRIGCVCKKPNKEIACHGDVLAEIADGSS